MLTKASHSNAEIARSLWRHVWQEQLGLESEEQFWEALRTRKPVERDAPAGPSRPTLPGWLVEKLLNEVGVAEGELRKMTEEDARTRLHEHWSQPRPGE